MRARFTLRITIAGLLVGLLLLALGGAVAIAMVVRAHSVEATARTILGEVSRGMADRLKSRVEPAEDILRECVRAAERGYLPVGDMKILAERLAERIRHDRRFESLAFLTPGEEGGGALRRPDGDVLLLYSAPGAPGEPPVLVRERLRPDDTREELAREPDGMAVFRNVTWYQLAANSEDPVWTKRYVRPVDGTWGRACAAPLRDGEQLRGVFGIGYGLVFIGEYLRDVRAAETGRLFGVHAATGEITVAPAPEARERLGPAVETAVARLRGGVAGLVAGEPVFESVDHAGVKYVVALDLQQMSGALRWVNAVVVPEKELVGFLDRYATAALAGIAVLLLVAIVVAQLLARRIARPLRTIAQDIGKVAHFELSETPAPPTQIEEIATVGDAVARMKAGLRSFSRYVPTDLVRRLLSEGQEARLDGHVRPLSLFFSDVKGFTSLSEGMEPQVLVDTLGEYLDVVTKAVSGEQGTIDKFMGDGVLAFFNAPEEDAEHAVHACRAALRVQEILAISRPGWEADGRPPFLTRIGLHTDEVVVGNIGTPDRFSYTVLGDGVNFAARLESLNKAYGTWILASEEMQVAAGPGFEWRRVDRTSVAGRVEGGDVYELLGDATSVAADALEARDLYESALAAYLARRFEEAVGRFEDALRLRPDDAAAGVLRARAAEYLENPPPSDWNGTYAQMRK